MTTPHKALERVEIKDADAGTVAAVFSTFDVIDSDGDVTLKGAFTDGAKVAISAYGHQSWKGLLPVGKGAIRETDTEAVFEGRFFLDTQAGADTFAVVKEMSADDGPGQQWSYGLRNVQSEMGEHEGKRVRFLKSIDVPEVSPVLLGAGVNTRTLEAKSSTFSEHAAAVMADVDELITRAADVMALRAQKGKTLSASSAELLEALDGDLERLKALLTADPITPTPADDDAAREAFAREFLRFVEHNPL